MKTSWLINRGKSPKPWREHHRFMDDFPAMFIHGWSFPHARNRPLRRTVRKFEPCCADGPEGARKRRKQAEIRWEFTNIHCWSIIVDPGFLSTMWYFPVDFPLLRQQFWEIWSGIWRWFLPRYTKINADFAWKKGVCQHWQECNLSGWLSKNIHITFYQQTYCIIFYQHTYHFLSHFGKNDSNDQRWTRSFNAFFLRRDVCGTWISDAMNTNMANMAMVNTINTRLWINTINTNINTRLWIKTY